MSTFNVDSPLEVTVRFGAGHLTVATSEDGQASATVEALDRGDKYAVELAASTRIELDGNELSIVVPERSRRRGLARLDVRLTVPPLSDLTSTTGEVTLRTEGELSTLELRAGMGTFHIDSASEVSLKAGEGTVHIESAAQITAKTGRGDLTVGSAEDVYFKTGQGKVELGTTSGEVQVKGGMVSLDVRQASSGSISFQAALGNAHVGVAEGTTVELDLSSALGQARCELPMEEAKPRESAALQVRLKTASGDVVVTRAVADAPAA